jgi:putative adhesin
VEEDGRGGDVDVGGVSGNVTVSGDFSGAVQFRDVAQGLRYSSSRTELSTQRLSGRLYMEMGSLDARGVDGPFELSTRQKDISLDGFAHSLKISNTNGEIRLRAASAPKQSIDVTSERGGIELELPENSSFQIQADSSHGEVNSDFSGANLKVVTEGDKPSITGSYGKGGPMIHLSTSYGTIRLAHAGPQPPAPPETPAAPGSKQTLHRVRPSEPHSPRLALLVRRLAEIGKSLRVD